MSRVLRNARTRSSDRLRFCEPLDLFQCGVDQAAEIANAIKSEGASLTRQLFAELGLRGDADVEKSATFVAVDRDANSLAGILLNVTQDDRELRHGSAPPEPFRGDSGAVGAF